VVEATFIHLMEVVMQYYSHATMYPTVYTDEQLKRIDHPALLLIGSEDKIKAIRRAQRWIPDLTA